MTGNSIISSRAATALAAVLLLALPGAVRAADVSADQAAKMFDVAFGIAVTTDYISRGITQTDHDPAIQGYVEGDYDIFYAGVWASNVSFGGVKDTEIDLSVGLRPELDKFSFDFGYVHYVYAEGNSPDFGELYAQANYAATDAATLGAKVYFAPDYSQSGTSAVYGELNSAYDFSNGFSLSGAVGYQGFDAAYGPSYLTWNAGISYKWKDTVKFDLRYSDTNLSAADCGMIAASTDSCDARLLASISIDSSWSALKGGGDK